MASNKLSTHREFYEFYKKERRIVSKEINEFAFFKRTVYKLLNTIQDITPETENGLYLKDFGYLYSTIERKRKMPLKIKPTQKSITEKVKRKIKFDFFFEVDEDWIFKPMYLFRRSFLESQTPKKEGVEFLLETLVTNNKIIQLTKEGRFFDKNNKQW